MHRAVSFVTPLTKRPQSLRNSRFAWLNLCYHAVTTQTSGVGADSNIPGTFPRAWQWRVSNVNSVTWAKQGHLEQYITGGSVKMSVKPRFGSNALLDTWWQKTLQSWSPEHSPKAIIASIYCTNGTDFCFNGKNFQVFWSKQLKNRLSEEQPFSPRTRTRPVLVLEERRMDLLKDKGLR